MPEITDQDDIIAQNEQLAVQLAQVRETISRLETDLETVRAEKANLTAQLAQASQGNVTLQETLAARTRERDDLAQRLNKASKERDDLKAENEGLKNKQADFEKAVAAKIAQMGFTKQAVSQAIQPDTQTRNYTEECRAAKGQ